MHVSINPCSVVHGRGWPAQVPSPAGRARCAAIVAMVASLIGAAPLSAQTTPDSFFQQQRVIDERLAQQRFDAAPLNSILDWQWGGWLEYYIFDFDDGAQEQRTIQRPAGVTWTRLTLDNGAHEIFARMRLRYTYFDPGDEIDRQEDWDGPRFEQVWYRINIGRAFRLTAPSDPFQASAKIGRQPVVFGTGYALDLPMDAVTWELKADKLRMTGLAARTIPSLPNIDPSPAVDTHSDRRFLGVQLNYDGFQRHQPFVYAFWNDDATDERPQDYTQGYGYDTFYFGAGSRGEIAPNLAYWGEAVLETGQGYNDGDFLRRNDVEAFAANAGVEKRWLVRLRPRVAAEYMFASGDNDRLVNATGALGGNRRDHEDNAFVGFGFRDTGLATGFALSNLHIIKSGASFTPFEEIDALRDMELGTNWFLYYKNQSRGALSDATADNFSGYVGWEMDYFINWRLSSDLAWTFRWGSFFPGSAYSDRDYRHFVFTGITWSF